MENDTLAGQSENIDGLYHEEDISASKEAVAFMASIGKWGKKHGEALRSFCHLVVTYCCFCCKLAVIDPDIRRNRPKHLKNVRIYRA